MAKLPSGTVTFLLTDVEGSTALWEAEPEAMRAALARHDVLFERAVEEHGGVHIRPRGEGDSRFAVFASAPDAVAAALAIQRAFANETWPTPRPIKVRIGVHTGEAELRDGDYYGSAVNRCARLRSIGHGGQVLLSEATAALVRDGLPGDARLRDLGEHRLRDLSRPERVYQVLASSLPADFPLLRSLNTLPNNLPRQPTPFVGREQQIQALRSRMLRDDIHLLTLTGPGGTGKSRLALQGAADLLDAFADGAFFVSLAEIADPDLVPSAVAQVLGVQDSPEQPLSTSLATALGDKALLLVLDNFEHLTEAAPCVADLLAACPRLKVLVTSRINLNLYGEHELSVPPLALPDQRMAPTAEQAAPFESVRLFVERAQAACSDFVLTDENAADVAEICRRLDGLPLAIELAAARLRALPVRALLGRLERRLPLLTGGPRDLPARQRTLRDAIAWSYDLLDADQQTLFLRLAVFRGCTLEAIEAVCCAASTQPGSTSIAVPALALDPLDGAEALVAASLLRQEAAVDGQPWYVMLETIREYALGRLGETDEAAAIHRRHVMHYLAFAEKTNVDLIEGARVQSLVLARIAREHDNLRAALAWCTAQGYAEPALRLPVALWWFWILCGHIGEGRQILDDLLARFKPRDPLSRLAAIRARAVQAAGLLAALRNDHAAARRFNEEALDLFRQQEDPVGLQVALDRLALGANLRGDHQTAWEILQERITPLIAADDSWALSSVLYNLASVALDRHDLGAVRSLIDQATVALDRHENLHGLAVYGMLMASLLEQAGDLADARALYQTSLEHARTSADPRTIGQVLTRLGSTAMAQRDFATAHASFAESARVEQELGDLAGIADVLERFATLAAAQELWERSLRLAASAAALRDGTDNPLPPESKARLDRMLEPAREAIGRQAAGAAWAAGRALSLDDAIAEALQQPSPVEAVADRPAAPHEPSARPAAPEAATPASILTAREREVAALIGLGWTNKQIADKLIITEGTAAIHVAHIRSKLDVRSRAQVAVWAAEHGLAADGA